ncbi:PIF-5/odv-e56 [Macrobrachium rosenbergii nudivirus]|nr:PIF-5/odv-e56 [Macrobrachium rosenbergii nudivirus]
MSKLRSVKWLDDINVGSFPLKNADDFTKNVDIVKNAQSGIKNIDDVFKSLPMTQVGDEIFINGKKSFREVNTKFRKGELNSAFADVDVATTITSADEAVMRKALKEEVPDIDIANLDNNINVAKKHHEDLNVDAKDGADLEGKLSNKSKEKVKSMYSKIKKVVGVGVVAAGVFTALYITDKVYDDLAEATNNRNGCFIVYKNTNTVACKLPARGCGFGDEGAPPCETELIQKTTYNIRLMVLDIIQTSDTASVKAVNDAGGDWQTGDTADDVLGRSQNISILNGLYPTKYPTIDSVTFNPCTLAGVIKGCVACNSALPTNDIGYCSSETLDTNMVYKCVTDSTVIDTLTDIATNLGVDLFTASGDSVSGSFQGNFFMVLIIILVLIVLGALALKFIPRKSDKVTEKSTVSQFDRSSPNNSNSYQQQQPMATQQTQQPLTMQQQQPVPYQENSSYQQTSTPMAF